MESSGVKLLGSNRGSLNEVNCTVFARVKNYRCEMSIDLYVFFVQVHKIRNFMPYFREITVFIRLFPVFVTGCLCGQNGQNIGQLFKKIGQLHRYKNKDKIIERKRTEVPVFENRNLPSKRPL